MKLEGMFCEATSRGTASIWLSQLSFKLSCSHMPSFNVKRIRLHTTRILVPHHWISSTSPI